MTQTNTSALRKKLVLIALQWEKKFGVMPAITCAISEYDVATRYLGMTEDEYSLSTKGKTAVQRHIDIKAKDGSLVQVKANRPSGGAGSSVTLTSAKGGEEPPKWDWLFWVLYDKEFVIKECIIIKKKTFFSFFKGQKTIRPGHFRSHGRLITDYESSEVIKLLEEKNE